MKNAKKGFTLIELLIVISIIALLTSIVLAALQTARARGRDTQRISDVRQLRNALQLYYADHSGTYPTDFNSLVTGGYIPRAPIDPLDDGTSLCRSGSYCYAYYPQTNPTTYLIGTQLEQPNVVLNSDLDCNASSPGPTCRAPQYAPNGGSCSLSICRFDGTISNIYDLAP